MPKQLIFMCRIYDASCTIPMRDVGGLAMRVVEGSKQRASVTVICRVKLIYSIEYKVT